MIASGVLLGPVTLSRGLVAAREGKSGHKLTILFTGDDRGNVKGACGCGSQPALGGVPVRAAYVSKVRESEQNVLLLDVGDATGGTGRITEIKVKAYEKAFRHMAYDAIGVGDKEALFIKNSGKPRPYGNAAPMICANMVDATTGTLFAEKPYIVKTTESGLRVGVISVLGCWLPMPGLREKAGIRVVPATEALPGYVRELREKCDLIVLLSHTGYEVSKRLAEDVPGIDVILSGHSSLSCDEGERPKRLGDAVVMQTTAHGRYVCRLELDIGRDGKIKSFAGKYVGLPKGEPADPEMAEVIEQHDEELRAHYESLRATSSSNGHDPHQPIGSGPFLSAFKCGDCHPREYALWMKNDHARAFESLKKDKNDSDPECLVCHTLGFTVRGGFTSEAATPELTGVQCEECHGTGAEHAREPEEAYGAVPKSACERCHVPERSPKFDYEKYRPKILHVKPGAVSPRAPAGP